MQSNPSALGFERIRTPLHLRSRSSEPSPPFATLFFGFFRGDFSFFNIDVAKGGGGLLLNKEAWGSLVTAQFRPFDPFESQFLRVQALTMLSAPVLKTAPPSASAEGHFR